MTSFESIPELFLRICSTHLRYESSSYWANNSTAVPIWSLLRFTKGPMVKWCVGCNAWVEDMWVSTVSNNDRERNRIFGFRKMEKTIFFSQNCLVTLVITASFEFWFLVRSQLAPRFLRESFLLNSKLILNQNPCTLAHAQKSTCKKCTCVQKSTYCRSIPFHMICKGRIMIIVIDLSIRTQRATPGICRHSICIFS